MSLAIGIRDCDVAAAGSWHIFLQAQGIACVGCGLVCLNGRAPQPEVLMAECDVWLHIPRHAVHRYGNNSRCIHGKQEVMGLPGLADAILDRLARLNL